MLNFHGPYSCLVGNMLADLTRIVSYRTARLVVPLVTLGRVKVVEHIEGDRNPTIDGVLYYRFADGVTVGFFLWVIAAGISCYIVQPGAIVVGAVAALIIFLFYRIARDPAALN